MTKPDESADRFGDSPTELESYDGESLLGSGYSAGSEDVHAIAPPPDDIGLGAPEMKWEAETHSGEPAIVPDEALPNDSSSELGSASNLMLGCAAILGASLLLLILAKKDVGQAATLVVGVLVAITLGCLVTGAKATQSEASDI
jgi:hypothetical protein